MLYQLVCVGDASSVLLVDRSVGFRLDFVLSR